MTNEHTRSEIRIYGCGGCGINLATPFAETELSPGYAQANVSFIDTSKSNYGTVQESTGVALNLATTKKEGSGKVRRDNASEISENLRDILMSEKPADFNVVVFSAAGGSGSVIGPLLMGELLAQDIPCVAVIVGSSESNITAINTINTLRSLASIGEGCGKPVVINYHHNSKNTVRSTVDKVCNATIHTLAALCSESNDELDQRDVANWVFYNHSTTVDAQLSLLEVCNNTEAAMDIKHPISVASILVDKDATPPAILPEYSCIGYRAEGFGELAEELHYIISVDGIRELMKLREDEVAAYKKSTESRRVNTSHVLTDDDRKSTAVGGLVL